MSDLNWSRPDVAAFALAADLILYLVISGAVVSDRWRAAEAKAAGSYMQGFVPFSPASGVSDCVTGNTR